MNAAARVISNTQKYDSGLSLLRYEELHWLSTSLTGCATSWQYWHTVRYIGPLHST